MKLAVLAVTVAALTVPVWFAAPAHASNDVHIRVDPRDWAFSGSISIYSVDCDNDNRGCEKSDIKKIQDFNVEPGVPMQNILDWTWDAAETYIVELSDVTLTGGGATLHPDSFEVRLFDPPLVGSMYVSLAPPTTPDSVQYDFGKPGGEYELKFYPRVWAQSLQNVTSAADVRVSQTDTLTSGMQRSKNTGGYVIDQPGRVTAMAKRFIAAPNSLINIHGYGPDKGVALAKGKHVREHLQSEITRLGGNPANYPTFVTYAGDPGHKKGVHVTIHQHDASSIAMR